MNTPEESRYAYDETIDQLVKENYDPSLDQIAAGKLIQSLLPSAFLAVCRVDEAWVAFFDHWLDLVRANRSRSVLANDGVRQQSGRNKKIERRIDDAFIKANTESDPYEKALILIDAKVHPRYVLEDTPPFLVSKVREAGSTIEAIEGVNALRNQLVNSVLKMITQAAADKYRELIGDVIEYSDLFSEAWAAAWEATLRYDPSRNTLFTTLVKTRIYGHLTNYIADSTRTVKVSRNLLDKVRLVRDAMSDTGSQDSAVLAKAINVALAEKKQKKLTRNEIMTPSLVDQVLAVMLPSTSLDIMVSEEEVPAREIKDEAEHVENMVIFDNALSRLRQILPTFLKKDEWNVLSIRWGLVEPFTEPQTIKATILEYRRRYPGSSVNRNRIKEMENAVLGRLHTSEHLRELYETLTAARNHQE